MPITPPKILVIEDNRASLDLMVYLLRAGGYTPVSAMDGLEGIEAAWRERPDVILCDIQLPGADGIHVCKELKNNLVLNIVPIIAVTAYAMVGDREKLLAQGFDGYLSKPIDPRTFVEQIKPYLPIDRATLAVARPGSQQVGASQYTILVVDNSPVNVALSRSMLEPFGHQIIGANGVDEAMKLLSEQTPDAIIADLHMPEKDGFDFIQEIKADTELRKIPFLFISSTLWAERERERALSLGADQFIVRPIAPGALIAEIETAVRRAAPVKGTQRLETCPAS